MRNRKGRGWNGKGGGKRSDRTDRVASALHHLTSICCETEVSAAYVSCSVVHLLHNTCLRMGGSVVVVVVAGWSSSSCRSCDPVVL